MLNFLIKRLLLLVPVFLAVSMVIFMIIHMVPGDPIDNMIQIGSSPEQRAQLVAKYGLDKPLVVQYGVWFQNMLKGDLGDAIILRRPVAELILENLPHSLLLGCLAFVFSAVVGVATGATAAVFKDSWIDRGVMTFILLGSTLPSFWHAFHKLDPSVQKLARAAYRQFMADPANHPVLIHCYAGVSRSTAAAFIAACALNPTRDEAEIARAIRAASPTATPNARLVAIGDSMLERGGRMSAAIEGIGRGEECFEGVPFALELA